MMNGRKAKYELNDEVAVILETVIASGKVVSVSHEGDTYTYGVALDDFPIVVKPIDEKNVRDKSDYEPEDDEDYDDEDYDDEDYDEYDEDDYEEDDYPEVDDDDEDDEDECCCGGGCCYGCCHRRECCSPTPHSRTSHSMPIGMGVLCVEADSLPEAIAKMRIIMGM